jgi:solute carrier family 25 phosphate transporter 23/24/25/41
MHTLTCARPHPHTPAQVYSGQMDALATIARTEGVRGFYRGWAANTIKVVPQNSIRFVTYEALKALLGVKRAKTDT